MKKITIILSVFVIASGCGQATKKPTINENSSVCQKDTSEYIYLSKIHGLLFLKYDKEMELWYEPRIVDFDRNDTLKIKGLSYENGFESFVSLSPNEQYVVIDNIIKGYVETPTGRELHENYKCVLIDLFSARVLDFWQSECSGEWDENSNWVNGDKIVFLSEMTK